MCLLLTPAKAQLTSPGLVDCLFVCTYDYDLYLSRLEVTIP